MGQSLCEGLVQFIRLLVAATRFFQIPRFDVKFRLLQQCSGTERSIPTVSPRVLGLYQEFESGRTVTTALPEPASSQQAGLTLESCMREVGKGCRGTLQLLIGSRDLPRLDVKFCQF